MPSKFPAYLDPATLRWVADGMERNAKLADDEIERRWRMQDETKCSYAGEIAEAHGVRGCSLQATTWLRSAATRIENRKGDEDE